MANEKTRARDLRGQSEEELAALVRSKSEELFKLRFQFSMGQLENVARLGQVKKEIARAKTVIAEQAGSRDS